MCDGEQLAQAWADAIAILTIELAGPVLLIIATGLGFWLLVKFLIR
jgi:hypothetical protein